MAQSNALCHSVLFSGQHSVELSSEPIAQPNAQQVLIKTQYSAISAGTEMLVYRGQLPKDIALDASLESLNFANAYPMKYGYACVGTVIQCGAQVEATLLGKTVFVFHPHSSHIVINAASCVIVPEGIDPEAALFLANMETAVNLVQDVNPVLGERGIVLGQGIVGLLVSALLNEFPLTTIHALDHYPRRREIADSFNGVQSIDSNSELAMQALHRILFEGGDGADFIVELTGVPQALNQAIDMSGFGSRIIIGSWYGDKESAISLGGKVHRNRLTIYSSQVSSIAPQLTARWDKARRFSIVWNAIERLQPEKFITHRVPIEDSSSIYRTLDSDPKDVVQAILVY